MSWTVEYFRHQAVIWRDRAGEAGSRGASAYAVRKASMWEEMAWFAEELFREANYAYKPITT